MDGTFDMGPVSSVNAALVDRVRTLEHQRDAAMDALTRVASVLGVEVQALVEDASLALGAGQVTRAVSKTAQPGSIPGAPATHDAIDALAAKLRAERPDWTPDPQMLVGAAAIAQQARAEGKAEGLRAAVDGAASRVYLEIAVERVHQDAKWGGHAHDDEHTNADWRGFIYDHTAMATGGAARKQFLRVAALAVAAVEAIDRRAAREGK